MKEERTPIYGAVNCGMDIGKQRVDYNCLAMKHEILLAFRGDLDGFDCHLPSILFATEIGRWTPTRYCGIEK